MPQVRRRGGQYPGRGYLSGCPQGALLNPVWVYLLWVVQADPHGQVSLVAAYVLCYDFGFLRILYRRQVGSVSKGLALELWAKRSGRKDAWRLRSTTLTSGPWCAWPPGLTGPRLCGSSALNPRDTSCPSCRHWMNTLSQASGLRGRGSSGQGHEL